VKEDMPIFDQMFAKDPAAQIQKLEEFAEDNDILLPEIPDVPVSEIPENCVRILRLRLPDEDGVPGWQRMFRLLWSAQTCPKKLGDFMGGTPENRQSDIDMLPEQLRLRPDITDDYNVEAAALDWIDMNLNAYRGDSTHIAAQGAKKAGALLAVYEPLLLNFYDEEYYRSFYSGRVLAPNLAIEFRTQEYAECEIELYAVTGTDEEEVDLDAAAKLRAEAEELGWYDSVFATSFEGHLILNADAGDASDSSGSPSIQVVED